MNFIYRIFFIFSFCSISSFFWFLVDHSHRASASFKPIVGTEKSSNQHSLKFPEAIKELKKLRHVAKISPGSKGHGDRHALIIGNDNYENLNQLAKAVGDAARISEVLSDLDFKVTLLKDAGIDETDDQLDAFYEKLKPGDVAFFFFAGHGVAKDGANYLLPVDVPKFQSLKGSRIKRKAVDAGRIAENIKKRGAELAFIVLDACREDPFRRTGLRGLASRSGLGPMKPYEGIFIIYSAGIGQTALDALSDSDPDRNSVFTRKFWRILKTPGLPIIDIAKRTQVEVKELANKVEHDQAPAYYDQVIGQFYFQPPKPNLYGLVIGIDEYNRKRQLNGAVNDAKRITKALKGVGATKVVSIYDRDARRKFIDFAWRSLVDRASPGDTIVFSYSGGSSQFSRSNQSKEEDRQDEFLVLADFDWEGHYAADKNGKFIMLNEKTIDKDSIILDDTLTDWMELAADKNINVILVIDGCHAGGLLDREFANVSFIGASSETESVSEILIDGFYHGAVSVAFSNAIIGKADINSDGFVSQRELFQYILTEVYRVIPQGQNPQFFPDLKQNASHLALFKTPKQKHIDLHLAPDGHPPTSNNPPTPPAR